MIKIHRKEENGKYTLFDEQGDIFYNFDFNSIKPVCDNSFYYCLYETPASFLLYHVKGRFINVDGNERRNKAEAAFFDKIEDYSDETNTFIAHLRGDNTVFLIKDNNSILGYIKRFIFVGNECDDYDRSRPVQLLNRSHIFFNCKDFKYAWNENYAYDYEPNEVLGKKFGNGYFTIYDKIKKTCRLAFYDKDNGSHYFNGIEYDEIEQYHKRYLICRIHGKNLFTIYDKTLYLENEVKRVTFAGRYFEIKDGLLRFKSLDFDHWVLFKTSGAKTIENNNWIIDKEIEVIDNFIFHGSNDTEWKIYSLDGQKQYYTDWKNIKLIKTDNKIRLIVDTNEQSGHEVDNVREEIKTAESLLLKRLAENLNAKPKVEPTQKDEINVSTDKKDEFTSTSKINNFDTQIKENSGTKIIKPEPVFDKLPNKIDYIVIFEHVKISNGNVICKRKKDSQLKFGNIILFIDETKHLSYCCEYRYGGYPIIWHKNDHIISQSLINILNNQENKKAFHRIDLTDFNKNNLYTKIEEKIDKNLKNKIQAEKEAQQAHEAEKYTTIINFLNEQNLDSKAIEMAMSILMPNFTQTHKTETVRFTFNETDYILVKDQQWSTTVNPFSNGRFLRRKDEIIVWIDYTVFNEHPYSKDYDYEMYGEGSDIHENQVFMNNSNTEIRDGKKRVLLFKKETHKDLNDPIFRFYDEVECIGYDYIHEDDVNSRRIINFHLKSKFRNKDNK